MFMDLILVRSMRYQLFTLLCLLQVLPCAVAQIPPPADHRVLNATSGPIIVTSRSSRGYDLTEFRLLPKQAFGFDGVFKSLKARLHNGKVISFSEQQLRQLHGGSIPTPSFWIIDEAGLHAVSRKVYNDTYGRLPWNWPAET
jgi:hypothetical protein